jgi:hypothetical protein
MPARRMAAANLELRWHSSCQMGRGNSSLPDLIRQSILLTKKEEGGPPKSGLPDFGILGAQAG